MKCVTTAFGENQPPQCAVANVRLLAELGLSQGAGEGAHIEKARGDRAKDESSDMRGIGNADGLNVRYGADLAEC